MYLATAGTVLYEELLHLCNGLLFSLLWYVQKTANIGDIPQTNFNPKFFLAYLCQGFKDYNGIYNGKNL